MKTRLLIALVSILVCGVANAHQHKGLHVHRNGKIIWWGDDVPVNFSPGVALYTPAHAKHKMILLGTDQIFASHIVYKEPHNYQVVLQLALPTDAQAAYLEARQAHPNALFTLFLNPINMAEINSLEFIEGAIQFEEEGSAQQTVSGRVRIPRSSFRVIYFEQLPLSLRGE